jgi:hypothetical protein
MTRPRTLLLVLTTIVALGVGLAVRSADADPSTVIEATVVPVQKQVVTQKHPSVDHGTATAPADRQGTTQWRVVHNTGNCC